MFKSSFLIFFPGGIYSLGINGDAWDRISMNFPQPSTFKTNKLVIGKPQTGYPNLFIFDEKSISCTEVTISFLFYSLFYFFFRQVYI